MKISVVVPAFNEEKLIERSLSAIRLSGVSFERLGWQWEMIVCNNNSTDRTAELAEAAGAKIVFEPVNQISRARNRGASVATGDWLMFIDADSFPSAELFGDVATVIQSGTCIGGGSTVRLDDFEGFIRGIAWSWNWLSRWKRWMAGSFVFCPANVFRQLGGFSDQLFAAEELDFSKRLKTVARHRGLKVVILHQHPLLTSGRKAHLYSNWEHLRMLLRTAWRFGGNLNERSGCPLWYDGRR